MLTETQLGEFKTNIKEFTETFSKRLDKPMNDATLRKTQQTGYRVSYCKLQSPRAIAFTEGLPYITLMKVTPCKWSGFPAVGYPYFFLHKLEDFTLREILDLIIRKVYNLDYPTTQWELDLLPEDYLKGIQDE